MRKIKNGVKEKNGYKFIRFLKCLKVSNFQIMEFCSKLLNRKSGIILHCSYPKTAWEIKYTKNIDYWCSVCILSTDRIFNSCKRYPHLCQLKYNNSILNSRVKTGKSEWWIWMWMLETGKGLVLKGIAQMVEVSSTQVVSRTST